MLVLSDPIVAGTAWVRTPLALEFRVGLGARSVGCSTREGGRDLRKFTTCEQTAGYLTIYSYVHEKKKKKRTRTGRWRRRHVMPQGVKRVSASSSMLAGNQVAPYPRRDVAGVENEMSHQNTIPREC